MKLFRFSETGKEKPGVLVDGKQYDTSAFGEDYGEVFFESDGVSRLEIWLAKNKSTLPLVKEGYTTRSLLSTPVKNNLHWSELHQARV